MNSHRLNRVSFEGTPNSKLAAETLRTQLLTGLIATRSNIIGTSYKGSCPLCRNCLNQIYPQAFQCVKGDCTAHRCLLLDTSFRDVCSYTL